MNSLSQRDLKAIIAELEEKKEFQEKALVAQFTLTYESLKPINMIRSTLFEMGKSGDLKNNLLDAALGLGAGMITKKLWVGNSGNLIKNIGGAMLEFGVAGIVAKNADKIKSLGKGWFNHFLSRGKSGS